MKQNRILARLRAGRPAVITWCVSGSPIMAELMVMHDFDGLLLCAQHGYWSYDGLLHALGTVNDTATTPIVRVASNDYALIGRALDAGAMGIVIPMVNTREDSEDAVANCLYPPEGLRSSGGPRRDRLGSDYVEKANEETLVTVMIETREAVGNAAEIASVPGVGAVMIGPGDLAMSLGCFPELSDEHEESIQRVIAACKEVGTPVGMACADADECILRASQGMTFLACGSDAGFVGAGAAAHLAKVREGTADLDA